MRWPGIEPGSTAWKATMLTITPPSPLRKGFELNNRLSYKLFLSGPCVKQHKGSHQTSRAYHTNVNSPWPSSLLPCLHYNFQPSCILRLVLLSALQCRYPYGGHKTNSPSPHRHKALYTVYSSRPDEKPLATARKFLSHCTLTR